MPLMVFFFFFWLMISLNVVFPLVLDSKTVEVTVAASNFDGHEQKRPAAILRLRQLPPPVSTVTATVTLTVTNTASPVPPSSSIASFPLATATNPPSEIPSSPPTFVTATDQDLPPPSSLPSVSLPSSISPAASARPTPPLDQPPSSSSSTSTADLFPSTSSLLPSVGSPSTSVSTRQSSPSGSLNPNSSSSGDDNTRGEESGREPGEEDRRGLNRLLVPFIVISVLCSICLAAGFLVYLWPYLREARLGQQALGQQAGPPTIFEQDYAVCAKTFAPNPSGALDYQRSLSRKRNRKARLVDQPLPNQITASTAAASPDFSNLPKPDPRGLHEPTLWLPQTAAGPGLTRPA
ncbi:hypothetical protein PGT21_007395 [Puccinia graminis f. sp. tritici]|uniref:Uncharacterized protein n=1 Tax=Puccinia graminis f. sp. tritici TaxID=56615 RepID=A0A5B0NTF0_PUCGR|nr:hypothetical protein PGT21_007395 [Puccinia graminis f. sp. tritici]